MKSSHQREKSFRPGMSVKNQTRSSPNKAKMNESKLNKGDSRHGEAESQNRLTSETT